MQKKQSKAVEEAFAAASSSASRFDIEAEIKSRLVAEEVAIRAQVLQQVHYRQAIHNPRSLVTEDAAWRATAARHGFKNHKPFQETATRELKQQARARYVAHGVEDDAAGHLFVQSGAWETIVQSDFVEDEIGMRDLQTPQRDEQATLEHEGAVRAGIATPPLGSTSEVLDNVNSGSSLGRVAWQGGDSAVPGDPGNIPEAKVEEMLALQTKLMVALDEGGP